MVDPEKLLKEYASKHRDEPFTTSQARVALKVGEPALQSLLSDMVNSGELVGLPSGRFLFTTNADVAAFHIMREIAPNITFQEFMLHKDEPHLLARVSRDRDILKDPRGGI